MKRLKSVLVIVGTRIRLRDRGLCFRRHAAAILHGVESL